MTPPIAIVDYGMGNLRSVQKAFEHLGFDAEITSSSREIERADKVVLPGVGAFPDGMRALRRLGLDASLKRAIRDGKLFLGICLGLQLLFEWGTEGRRMKGLGIFPGEVVRFPEGEKVPQIGWNQVRFAQSKRACPLLKRIPDGSHFYFVHSYFGRPRGDRRMVAGTTDYGLRYPSILWRDRIFATQFHPEKSQNLGLQLLANFAKL